MPNHPLLAQSMRFYNHPESLVRNTSRSILLTIAKYSHSPTNNYLLSFPFSIYYVHLAAFLKEYFVAIDGIWRPTVEDNRY